MTAALRALADLLDGLPGLPTPFVWVSADSIALSFHEVDNADEHARIDAAEAVMAVVGGEARPQRDGTVGGEVRDWHGLRLQVVAYVARAKAVA